MRRKLLASIATAAVVCASFVTGASGASAADPVVPSIAIATGPGMLKVLQLGDSYSSGTGAHPFGNPATYVPDGPAANPAECTRSTTNYGQQFAEQLGAGYVNAACGGATFADITGSQNGNVAPQINAVDDTADIVLMTMGGNDFGFGTFAGACFVLKDPIQCQAAVANSSALTAPGGAIEQTALANLEAIRAKLRPDAKFLWLGYPRLSRAASVVLDNGAGTTYGDPYGPEIYHPKQIGWNAMADTVSAYYAANVAPTMQSASPTVRAGQSLTFSGEGWTTGAAATATLSDSRVQSLQSVTATAEPDQFGNVAFSLTVDSAAPAGTFTAQFADAYGRTVTVEFAVTAAPVVTLPVTTPPLATPPVAANPSAVTAAPVATPVRELANTRMPATDLAGIATLLLVAGGSLLWAGRRRTV